MKWRKWFRTFIILIFILLVPIISFNYLVDPLWCFSPVGSRIFLQDGFDERQQKTNVVTFSDFHYDTLILGSSRTTFINQNDLINHKAFNYAVNSMLPEEYNEYIEYAKKQRGKPFKYIVIGLDFFGTNINYHPEFSPPQTYISKAQEPFYRYKMLLSWDTLQRSWANYQLTQEGTKTIYYNEDNVKTAKPVPLPVVKNKIRQQLKFYQKEIYHNYQYKPMQNILSQLKANNPDTKFIIYTTPVSKPLFQLMVKENKFKYYEQWLKDSVEVFGSVYNFMDINSVTSNLNNYLDAHHFYPRVGKILAARLAGNQGKDIPQDFGVLLTKENLPKYLINKRDKNIH